MQWFENQFSENMINTRVDQFSEINMINTRVDPLQWFEKWKIMVDL